MTEKSIAENAEFINKYTPEEWVKIIKDLFLDFHIFFKEDDERIKYVYSLNNYTVEYADGKLNEITIFLRLREDEDSVKCHLSTNFIDFYKNIGRRQFEIYNRIPILALRTFVK